MRTRGGWAAVNIEIESEGGLGEESNFALQFGIEEHGGIETSPSQVALRMQQRSRQSHDGPAGAICFLDGLYGKPVKTKLKWGVGSSKDPTPASYDYDTPVTRRKGGEKRSL